MFRVEEIGECSTVCNTGEQRRLVECVMMVDGMVNQTLDDSDCISKGIMKPDEVIPCTKGPCFEFRDNGFGSVSSNRVGRGGEGCMGGYGRGGVHGWIWEGRGAWVDMGGEGCMGGYGRGGVHGWIWEGRGAWVDMGGEGCMGGYGRGGEGCMGGYGRGGEGGGYGRGGEGGGYGRGGVHGWIWEGRGRWIREVWGR